MSLKRAGPGRLFKRKLEVETCALGQRCDRDVAAARLNDSIGGGEPQGLAESDDSARIERDEGGFLVHTRYGGEIMTRAVIVATGARQLKLNVPGEKTFISKGLCYSALSYAPLFIDRKTVVIGNGDLVLRSAAELATVADHVHLVGPPAETLESPLGRKLAQSSNVTILKDHRVTQVLGNGYCNRVVVQGPEGTSTELNADGTFIEMGLEPVSQMVKDIVDLDEKGFIKVDSHGRTSSPGIFAAGDVTDSYAEQVLVAIGDGAKAALSAFDYLLPTL